MPRRKAATCFAFSYPHAGGRRRSLTLDATLLLSLALFLLSISSLGVSACVPFILWKLWKQDQKIEALDATLAEILTPKG